MRPYLFLTVILQIYSLASFAFPVSGTVFRTENALLIHMDQSNEPQVVHATEEQVKNLLQDLSTGDFLNGEAMGSGDNVLRLTAVNFVGFSRLLGVWTSPLNDTLRFHTFDLLSWTDAVTHQTTHYHYKIAPHSSFRWGFMMMNLQESWIGELSINRLNVTINLFEVATGKSRLIQLFPSQWKNLDTRAMQATWN